MKAAEFVLGLLLASFVGAARAADIPVYPSLICGKNCPRHVAAAPLRGLQSSYNAGSVENGEGFVDVGYTVGIDGRARNPIVERGVGSKAFIGLALAALKNVEYQPATDDGKPVSENRRFRFIFTMLPGQNGSHAAIEKDFDDATTLVEKNRIDAAVALLRKIAGAPGVTIHDLLMAASILAQLEARSGDYVAALNDSRIATIDEGQQLDPDVRERAFRLRVELEAQDGELIEALAAFDALQKVVESPLLAGDPDVTMMSRLRVAVDSNAPLTTAGSVTALGGEPHWQHVLLYRTFGITDVTGKLDKFTLRCGTHSFDSPVIDKAKWNVSPTFGGCVIYVFGEAGTTFNFFETPQAAVSQGSHS